MAPSSKPPFPPTPHPAAVSKVAVIHCGSYRREAVEEAVLRGFSLLGGARRFVRPGEALLLKPNILAPDPPEKCVTTHPEVFRAVAKLLLAEGAKLSYGDSPAVGSMERAAAKCGIRDAAAALEIAPADFSTGTEVFFEAGRQNKKFIIAQGVLEADGVVSLPKLKTHGLERVTGCVKNQFGCIPGLRKAEYHLRIPDALQFARMLLDLNRLIAPRLYVMDGIRAMEGNGPRGGTPSALNVLLFSTDPIALDAAVCRLIGLDPEHVPTVRYGEASGDGCWREGQVAFLGDDLLQLRCPSFDVVRRPVRPYRRSASAMERLLSNHLIARPVIEDSRCVRCGICVKACPVRPKAVDWFDGDKRRPPRHDYPRCIRCYCCQELCPESAITLKVPPLRTWLDRGAEAWRRLRDRLHKGPSPW